ncbi:MAG: hypothetical protein PHW69_07695 [Elusimicrobiaceae bacterium]|nr:hypothetical protein [Elusimicrobiaceae bacterium]
MHQPANTSPFSLYLGPCAPGPGGDWRIDLKLAGETVVSAEPELGLLFRCAEKLFESNSWEQGVTLAERIGFESPLHHALVYCMAVEKAAGAVVPQETETVRGALCEAERIGSHLGALHNAAAAAGHPASPVIPGWRAGLDSLFQLWGNPAGFGIMTPGGLRAADGDVLHAAKRFCESLRPGLAEIRRIFLNDPLFCAALRGAGALTAETARRAGLSGVNLRCAGETDDVRSSGGYGGYAAARFAPLAGERGGQGCALERFSLRVKEIEQSVSLIESACQAADSGRIKKPVPVFAVPAGEGYAVCEAPRGRLACYVKSGGGSYPLRVHFTPPSLSAAFACGAVLPGCDFEQAVMAAVSLDVSASEADR